MFKRRGRRAKCSYGRGEIVVTDPEVRKRLAFLGLTEDDLGVVSAWKEVCRSVTDALVDEFYAHIQSNQATQDFLLAHTTVERQRPLLTRYILTMFDGCIDDEYVEYRRRVGVTHEKIDLDFSWYVAMYEVMRRVLVKAVQQAGATSRELDRFKDAFGRMMLADITLCMTALTESRARLMDDVRQQQHEAETLLNATSEVLNRVAERDLAVRMEGDQQGAYATMKATLNSAVSNLDQSLSQVAMGAEQVAAAASQISSGSQALAQGASEQASTLEEISSSLEEFTSMSKLNTAHAQEVSALTTEARNSADTGAASMQRLSEAIDQIKAGSDETAKIVKTIDEIAFQTNLLALNAAVEAARAGDAGKGFAVVADEVRNLAMRSAEAAKNTAELIDGAVQRAEDGVTLNQEVLQNLETITGQIHKVSAVMTEMTAASEQQQQGVEQIRLAVEQLNQVTQQTAASAEESASTSEELSGQSAEMRHLVIAFKLTHAEVVTPPRSPHRELTRTSPHVTHRPVPSADVIYAPEVPVAHDRPETLIPFDDHDDNILSEF